MQRRGEENENEEASGYSLARDPILRPFLKGFFIRASRPHHISSIAKYHRGGSARQCLLTPTSADGSLRPDDVFDFSRDRLKTKEGRREERMVHAPIRGIFRTRKPLPRIPARSSITQTTGQDTRGRTIIWGIPRDLADPIVKLDAHAQGRHA